MNSSSSFILTGDVAIEQPMDLRLQQLWMRVNSFSYYSHSTRMGLKINLESFLFFHSVNLGFRN